MRNLTVKTYPTPEHLKALGIGVCSDCGSLLSIDNTTCYNCGFEPDDDAINEQALNAKYKKNWHDDDKIYVGIAKKGFKVHLVKNGIPLCGNKLHSVDQLQLVGDVSKQAKKFHKNPCSCCKSSLSK